MFFDPPFSATPTNIAEILLIPHPSFDVKIQSVQVLGRPEDNRNVLLIDTLGGENIRVTGAFFGNAGNFQGYGVGQARYGDRYVGRNCYIDDSYLGGKATTVVDFTSRSLDLMFLCFFFCVCVCV